MELSTTRSPTYSDIYQRSYWYNWLSWWWALGCSKHVENWNKQIQERIVHKIGYLQRKPFIVHCDELFSPLSISALVHCYQPPCHKCLHLAAIFICVAAKILLLGCKQTSVARREFLPTLSCATEFYFVVEFFKYFITFLY